MTRALPFWRTVSFHVLAVLLLAACSSAPFRHEPLENFDVVGRAVLQERDALQVRAAVPGVDETGKIFGVPLYDRGIQPVWLEIRNPGTHRVRFVISSVDPDYFSPLEVAYMHRKRFSQQGWKDLERYLYQQALPRQIMPGETASGFVFTHASTGTKAFNVDLFETGPKTRHHRFTFFLEVPGFRPDHAEVDFAGLYPETAIRAVDNDGLRELLGEFPCCTTNRAGTAEGRPLTVVFVAEALDLLEALLHAGWSETAYERDEDYLDAAQHLFGRPPDAVFRKARDRSTERIELSLWRAPWTVDGRPVWLAQTRHAIGRRYELGERLLGVRLDPDLADGRNYVLQDIWYAQSLQHWAWSESLPQVSSTSPRLDFQGNPWFMTMPLRVVIWIAESPTAMQDATEVRWLHQSVYSGQEGR